MIIRHPVMEMRSRIAISMRREFGIRDAAKETTTIPRSIHAWVGIIISTV